MLLISWSTEHLLSKRRRNAAQSAANEAVKELVEGVSERWLRKVTDPQPTKTKRWSCGGISQRDAEKAQRDSRGLADELNNRASNLRLGCCRRTSRWSHCMKSQEHSRPGSCRWSGRGVSRGDSRSSRGVTECEHPQESLMRDLRKDSQMDSPN